MKYLTKLCLLVLVFALTGCASTRNPQDPLEGFNRTMFGFNDKVDEVAFKPVAEAYHKAIPPIVQTGVGNFFGNINDVSTACNNLMQARLPDGVSDASRVLVNTTVGLGGIVDFASDLGLPKHDQDFGQTLGRWGVKSGPYLVLPLLGSTTLRDALAMPVDFEMDPWGRIFPVRLRNTGSAIRVVDYRAYNLNSSSLIEDAALDKYEFVRDAYMQRRQSKIYTGDTLQEAPQGNDKHIPTRPAAGISDGARNAEL
jgi:phospholipid-binding lipoprotein MlaA